MAHQLIRDFIYLDVERIRSFVAQNNGGLPYERSHTGEHEVGGQGAIKGKLPLIAEASGNADYHYRKSESETLSLHDHIFAEFYDAITANHKLANVSSLANGHWIESAFTDGAYLLVHGPIKIIDYQATISAIQAMPGVEAAIKRITAPGVAPSGSRASAQGKTQGYRKDRTVASGTQGQSLQAMIPAIRDISSLINQFYGDTVRVKFFPFAEDTSKILAGTADRKAFRYSPVALTTLYGSVIDAGWVGIVQINRGTQHTPGALLSKTGNQLEDGLEQVVDSLSALSAITQGVEFPAVAITPIAIFREC